MLGNLHVRFGVGAGGELPGPHHVVKRCVRELTSFADRIGSDRRLAVLFVKTFGTFSASSRALACNLAAKTMIIK